jgi:DNA-binding PadR family transcriptional regulator
MGHGVHPWCEQIRRRHVPGACKVSRGDHDPRPCAEQECDRLKVLIVTYWRPEGSGFTLVFAMSESQPTVRHAFDLRSPIAWALLGLVIEAPGHGYELAQRFKHAYGGMLSLTYNNHVYKLLPILQARDLIEEISPPAEEKAAPNRLPKLHYRATERGVLAYQEWLLAQMEDQRQRSRLFARQIAMLEPQAALDVLDEYERECLADADEVPPAEGIREALAERLVEGEEQTTLEVRLSWIKYARSELEALIADRSRGTRGS